MTPGAHRLARTVGLEILGPWLASDVRASIGEALAAGAVFAVKGGPLAVFRAALESSIREIEGHERGRLLQRFLFEGPYEDVGDIPSGKVSKHLSDEDTATAIAFVHSFMVNSFKGAVAELLACGPCVRLVRELQAAGRLPDGARVFAGDAVLAATARGGVYAKGGDLHVLAGRLAASPPGPIDLLGVAEVKSYRCSQRKLRGQIGRHFERGAWGLRILGEEVAGERVRRGGTARLQPVAIGVVPASWKLPRDIEYSVVEGRKFLQARTPKPPGRDPRVTRTGAAEWRFVLPWSEEAIASAAYEMTCWYMAKVGEVLYRNGVPPEWAEMTPAEAGQNAVKMMLYYAILRARTLREEQRAIALYNTYGFGYALGMSFRDERGRREMLWPEDLGEIAAHGVTRRGCRFEGGA